jgi:hypothetical protein
MYSISKKKKKKKEKKKREEEERKKEEKNSPCFNGKVLGGGWRGKERSPREKRERENMCCLENGERLKRVQSRAKEKKNFNY